MPSDFQSKVKPVRKLTNNVDGTDKNAAVTATSDKLFMLSYSEIVKTPYSGWSGYSWIGNEGTQYEAFKGKVTNNYSGNDCLSVGVCALPLCQQQRRSVVQLRRDELESRLPSLVLLDSSVKPARPVRAFLLAVTRTV